ncbi:hypothetical protein GE061_009615 [Apolygus lucorum]|uniref:60 kDa chaperonin n=1 Tax=Apolygus lucorum TaxID=248454 RepID=A0A8S9Y2S6_APOLU|nr:hypothetical protein GE061_009615 [Apolygus lucorum]
MLSRSSLFRGYSHLQRRLFSTGRPCRAKDIRFGDPVRSQLLQGVEILAAAVGLTLGPKGRTVALEQYKSEPKITKDGFTVARAIDLRDSFQNVGAKLVVDVAENTNKKAGDGTSTATVLACSIARLAMDSIKKGCSPAEIRQGIMLGASKAVEHLRQISKPVTTPEEIKQVAVISANGDEHVGNLISTAMEKVGKHGIVTVKEGTTLHDEVEVINGLEIEHGYISPYFVNSKTGSKVEMTNCFILYCDFKVNEIRDIVPALELCVNMNRPLLIVAEDIEGDALTTLVINKMRNNLSVCAVKSPSFGEGRSESLKDLAAATGGKVFGDESDIEIRDVKVEHLGKADEVSITNEETLILKGKGDPEEIAKRAAQIDYLISKAKNEFIRDGLEERKSKARL